MVFFLCLWPNTEGWRLHHPHYKLHKSSFIISCDPIMMACICWHKRWPKQMFQCFDKFLWFRRLVRPSSRCIFPFWPTSASIRHIRPQAESKCDSKKQTKCHQNKVWPGALPLPKIWCHDQPVVNWLNSIFSLFEVIPFLKKYLASTLTKNSKRIHKRPFFKHRGTSDVTVPRQPSHLGSSTVPRCTSRRSPRRRSVHVAPWHKRFRGLGVADLYWFDIWHEQHDSSAYVMMCTRLWFFLAVMWHVNMMWSWCDKIATGYGSVDYMARLRCYCDNAMWHRIILTMYFLQHIRIIRVRPEYIQTGRLCPRTVSVLHRQCFQGTWCCRGTYDLQFLVRLGILHLSKRVSHCFLDVPKKHMCCM